jgi:hypothetical protein
MALNDVNIGYGSALDCWHDAACPAYSRFREASTRENAIKCAEAIENIRGWFWRETYPGIDHRNEPAQYAAFNQQLFQACPELELIKDIAESAKHGGQLGRSSVKVLRIEGCGLGGVEYVCDPLGTHERKPECTLRAVLNDGTEVPIPAMLERAMKFWRDKVS